ncbi:hypothetical protein CsSME_00010369 [Camellia sinensis var. sinensis]
MPLQPPSTASSTIDNYHPPLPASPSTTSTTTIRREKKKRRPITPPPLDSQPLWEANEIQLRGFPEALEKTQPSLLSSDWQTLWITRQMCNVISSSS